MFKPETHETQPPERVFGTLVEMITAVNRTGRDAWPQVLTRYFDVEHLMAYVAVESFLSDHDGLAGDWGINNFYLYRYAESERFRFIPWDKDVNFRETGRDVEAGFEGNPLLETALQVLAVPGCLPLGVAALRRDRGRGDPRRPRLARAGGRASGGDDPRGRSRGPEQGLLATRGSSRKWRGCWPSRGSAAARCTGRSGGRRDRRVALDRRQAWRAWSACASWERQPAGEASHWTPRRTGVARSRTTRASSRRTA